MKVRTIPYPVGDQVGEIPLANDIPPKAHLIWCSSNNGTPAPLWIPYFSTITYLHKKFSSWANLQSHLPNKALLSSIRFFTPNPHLGTGEQAVFQITRWSLGSPSKPSQRKSLWIRSNLQANDPYLLGNTVFALVCCENIFILHFAICFMMFKWRVHWTALEWLC